MAGQTAQKQSADPSPSSRNQTTLIIIAVLAILVALAAAGYFVQKKSNGETSKITEKTTQVKTENGKITITEGEVPKNFPSDITVYKGTQVITSTEAKDGISLTLKTTDSVKKAATFYKDDLAKNGWKKITSDTLKGSYLITAKKGDRELVLTVSVDKEDKKR